MGSADSLINWEFGDTWERAGEVSTDTGSVLLTDPCTAVNLLTGVPQNTLAGRAAAVLPDLGAQKQPRSWQSFCDEWQKQSGNVATFENGCSLLVSNGVGDGSFPVHVKRRKNGEIAAVLIVFDPAEEDRDA
jgi:hypothetical protein